jgi:hypothetical protein
MYRSKNVEGRVFVQKVDRLDQNLAFKKVIGSKNAVELKNMGRCPFRVKGKWENKVRKSRGINVDKNLE